MTSRRHFIRMLAGAGATLMAQAPIAALAAPRPALQMFFPQDPMVTWFDPTYGLVKPDGRRHLGIDLMAPKLTPVFAITEGTVNRIAKSPRAGRYVIVDHADGWQTWYLHLNNDPPGRDNGRADWGLTVVDGLEEGSHVTAGMHIGYVGDSGNAEGAGSHTHFELHLDSRTVNPYPYLLDSHRLAREAAHQATVNAEVADLCRMGPKRTSVDQAVCPAPDPPKGPTRKSGAI
ncbi:MAG: M23 family metallopeptidase [Actinomycetota bacterium]